MAAKKAAAKKKSTAKKKGGELSGKDLDKVTGGAKKSADDDNRVRTAKKDNADKRSPSKVVTFGKK